MLILFLNLKYLPLVFFLYFGFKYIEKSQNHFTIERFYYFLFSPLAPLRNDEVDDDHPNKEPLIHEVVLGVDGKVKKHNFEHKTEIPRGNYSWYIFKILHFKFYYSSFLIIPNKKMKQYQMLTTNMWVKLIYFIILIFYCKTFHSKMQ